jgi:hypothetical protein
MSAKDCNLLCWNVRGLNDGAKQASVRTQIIATGATIVCLQETKISTWTRGLLVDTVGVDLAANVAFLPSVGVCGGILIAASECYLSLPDSPHHEHGLGNNNHVGGKQNLDPNRGLRSIKR